MAKLGNASTYYRQSVHVVLRLGFEDTSYFMARSEHLGQGKKQKRKETRAMGLEVGANDKVARVANAVVFLDSLLPTLHRIDSAQHVPSSPHVSF